MASLIGLPLRVGNHGRRGRSDPVEALLQPFRVAASSKVWPHAPWFGPRQGFAEANPWLEDPPGPTDPFTAASPGLRWVHVERGHAAPTTIAGEQAFHVVIVPATGYATRAAFQV